MPGSNDNKWTITIEYDPEIGLVLPDGLIEEYVNRIVRRIQNNEPMYITVGGELIIDYLRLAVKQGKIDCNDIIFKYKDEFIACNSDGRLSRWPNGFCGYLTDVLRQL